MDWKEAKACTSNNTNFPRHAGRFIKLLLSPSKIKSMPSRPPFTTANDHNNVNNNSKTVLSEEVFQNGEERESTSTITAIMNGESNEKLQEPKISLLRRNLFARNQRKPPVHIPPLNDTMCPSVVNVAPDAADKLDVNYYWAANYQNGLERANSQDVVDECENNYTTPLHNDSELPQCCLQHSDLDGAIKGLYQQSDTGQYTLYEIDAAIAGLKEWKRDHVRDLSEIYKFEEGMNCEIVANSTDIESEYEAFYDQQYNERAKIVNERQKTHNDTSTKIQQIMQFSEVSLNQVSRFLPPQNDVDLFRGSLSAKKHLEEEIFHLTVKRNSTRNDEACLRDLEYANDILAFKLDDVKSFTMDLDRVLALFDDHRHVSNSQIEEKGTSKLENNNSH